MPNKSLSRSGLLTYQKYSSLLVGNDPYELPGQSYQLLSSQVLASSAATVEFANIFSSYSAEFDQLEVRYVARSSTTDVVDDLYIYINSDTASNYANHRMRGATGEVATNASSTYGSIYDGGYANTGNGAPSGSYGAGIISIVDPFSSNKFTTFSTLGGGMYASAIGYVSLNSAAYLTTDVIDNIKFDLRLGSYMAGSRFSLYGLKKAA